MEDRTPSALVKRSLDTRLMPPPAKRIKRPQKILEEDDYVSAVSKIIARDFFPGLIENETQQEYMDALESGDKSWISNASRRLNQVMTPGSTRGRRGTSLQTPHTLAADTPDGGRMIDTPMSVRSDACTVDTQAPRDEIDTNMSLSSFQARYTSEDNESFYRLLDSQNRKKAEKYAWMWTGNKMPSKQMLKQKEIETKLLANGRCLHDDGGQRDRLAISALGEKPAKPDSWNSRPKNYLMFSPDGVEDSTQTIAQKAQGESRAAPAVVAYHNTRLPILETRTANPPSSPSFSAIKDAIAGRPRMNFGTDFGGSETPRVNGYAFVDNEEPEEHIPIPIQIELPKADATPNPFKIKDQSTREDLLHRMVDKNARSKRISSLLDKDRTPVPSFPSSPRVAGGLTPAAQRLWNKVGRSTGSNSSSVSSGRTPVVTKVARSGLKINWTMK